MSYPIQRNLDGVYFRVERDGKWLNLCLTDLTLDEMSEILQDRDPEWYKQLIIHLSSKLRECGDTFDLVGGED